MFKKIGYVLLMICVILPILVVPSDRVVAKTLGDIKKELAQYKKDYEDNKLQKELSEDEVIKIRKDIESTNKNIEQIGKDIVSLNEEIEESNRNIEQKDKEIKDIMNFIQVSNGDPAYLEYAFGAQNFTDFIYRMAVSEQLTAYNDQLIKDYNESIEKNKKKTKELASKKIDLASEQQKLQVQYVKVQENIKQLDELSLDIKEEIEARESSIKTFENKGCKDNENIDNCGTSLLPPDTNFWRPVGVGEIEDWYGSRPCVDPRVSCFHYGLDMSMSGANTGKIPVYPVANGIVVYVVELTMGSNGRYLTKCGGRKIYIQHNVNGRTYTTGYLHLRRVDVRVGQTVTKDQQIGVVGGYPNANYEYWDNCSTGAHLHLEMSTGTFLENTYYAERVAATNYINFPRQLHAYWYDRKTKF